MATYKVTRELYFCYGHRLLNYDGKCAHPHGHNAKVEIELAASALDSRGMVYDFSDIKNSIQSWIDKELDHKMILTNGDPLIKALRELGEPFYVLDGNPTAENIAKLIYDHAASNGFPISEIRMWETDSSFATYRGKT